MKNIALFFALFILISNHTFSQVGIGTTTPANELEVNGWIGRTSHELGGLVGSYNNVAPNSSRSNPIYIIGSNYKPTSTTLGTNMYGIGYSHTNASFINAGSGVGWGLYVAADGDARIWLGATAGGNSYFNTGGRFGIGTDNPTEKLDVFPDTDNSALIGKVHIGNIGFADHAAFSHIDHNSTTNYALRQNFNGLTLLNAASGQSIRFRINNTDQMTVNSAGNVGIGTTSPSRKLHVNGSLRFAGNGEAVNRILVSDASGVATWQDATASITNSWQLTGNSATNPATNFIGTTDAQDLVFKTNNNERLRVLSGGNVGVGTTSPTEKLHVSGGDVLLDRGTSTSGLTRNLIVGGTRNGANAIFSKLQFQNYDNSGTSSDFIGAEVVGFNDGADDAGLQFNTATNKVLVTAMTIKKDGKVGIGTTSPTEKLDVFPDTDNSALIGKAHIGNVGVNDHAAFSHVDHNSTTNYALRQNFNGLTLLNAASGQSINFRINNVNRMIVNSAGNVGIGTTSPSRKLHVNGSLRFAGNGEAVNRILVSDASGVATWQDATASITNSWQLTGNSATNPATNFIGTTDAQDLVLKTNNNERLRIGDATNNPGLIIKGIASQTSNWLELQDNGGNVFARINSNGEFSNPTQSSGTNNEAYGESTLSSITTGSDNTGFGASSLNSLTTGLQNTAFGSQALNNNTTTHQNTAFGAFALLANNGGSGRNAAFGSGALQSATSSTDNTALGSGSLNGTTDPGERNTAVGSRTMVLSGTKGDDNVAVGYQALQGGTGSNNTIIGSNAGNLLSTGSNNIIIGSSNTANSPTSSNQLDIGDLIYGNLSTGNVGIGTPTPSTILNLVTDGAGHIKVEADGDNMDESHTFAILYSQDGGLVNGQFGFTPINNQSPDNTAYTGAIINSLLITNEWAGIAGQGGIQFGTDQVRMTIDRQGLVGIGTTTPGGQFELSLDQGRKPGTANWTIVSDSRLKTIKGHYDKGLNELKQLTPITYNYKNTEDRIFEPEILETEFVGFTAQEVQKIFPEAVGEDKDGYLNLNVHAIMIAYLNAIKELSDENELLKKQIKVHEASISELFNAHQTRQQNLEPQYQTKK